MEVSNPEDSIPRCPEDTAPASSDAYIERIRMPRSISLSEDTVYTYPQDALAPRVSHDANLRFQTASTLRSPLATNRPDQQT